MSTFYKSLTDAPLPLKKLYEKPKLEVLGDVRSITLGGSPGLGESGGKRKRNPDPPEPVF